MTDEFYEKFLSYTDGMSLGTVKSFLLYSIFRFFNLMFKKVLNILLKKNLTLKFDEDELFVGFNYVINLMKVKTQN